jgi:uncharacterized protein YjbJ (UPF0337 family)
MNEDILEGNWKQIRGRIKEFWGDITDDDLDRIEGQRDVLVGTLQERYGYTRQEAEDSLEDFLDDYRSGWNEGV